MRTFYVRPERESRYGAGDGMSYDNAWNGLAAVNWDALAACASAMVLVCGERVIALEVHWQ
ncbi:MAG TPA: hypothetical protein VE325_11860 [Burkholderiales bacterium]|jgi:hypothetical protein|nr:hypothetical protein [Burkholderiales bacterium]